MQRGPAYGGRISFLLKNILIGAPKSQISLYGIFEEKFSEKSKFVRTPNFCSIFEFIVLKIYEIFAPQQFC